MKSRLVLRSQFVTTEFPVALRMLKLQTVSQDRQLLSRTIGQVFPCVTAQAVRRGIHNRDLLVQSNK